MFRGFQLTSFKSSVAQIYIAALQVKGLKVSGVARHPTTIKRVTLHRSHFVNNKSQEPFERRTYTRSFYIEGDISTTKSFQEFLVDNLHSGAACKVYEHQYLPVESVFSLTLPQPQKSAFDSSKLSTMEDFERLSLDLTNQEINASPSSVNQA